MNPSALMLDRPAFDGNVRLAQLCTKLSEIEIPRVVGGKAAGLLSIDPEWTLPFGIFNRAFVQTVLEHGYSVALDRLNPTDRRDLLAIYEYARSNQLGLILRSNAIDEAAVTTHGKYDSYPCDSSEASLNAAFDVVCAETSESILPIIQAYVLTEYSGHLSNERCFSKEATRWLVDGIRESSLEFIRTSATQRPGALSAESIGELRRRLREVSSTLAQRAPYRYHCEWVWSGYRMWIVQCDKIEELTKYDGNKVLESVRDRRQQHNAFKVLRRFDEIEQSQYSKIEHPQIFQKLNLPSPEIYVLEGRDFLDQDKSQRIRDDLDILAQEIVIIRTDLRTNGSDPNALLATSPPFRESAEAFTWMERQAESFRASGLNPDQWTFLPAVQIEPMVSAMVQAFPDGQIGRVHATWGYPDGLHYLPHDAFIVDFKLAKIKQRISYKESGLFSVEGSWKSLQIGPPFDWQRSLSNEEVLTIANWAFELAKYLRHEVQLMVMCRIGGMRGPKGCLPFHFTAEETEVLGISLLALPHWKNPAVISDDADISKYRKEPPAEGGYLFKPDSSVQRDKEFIREVARLAKDMDRPVFLAGSPLAHPFYMIKEAGATVIPISAPEAQIEPIHYDKLVRDNIPAIVSASGGVAQVTRLSAKDAVLYLKQKLVEEAFECFEAEEKSVLAELADVQEVVYSIADRLGFTRAALELCRSERQAKRGGFEESLLLVETTVRPLSSSGVRRPSRATHNSGIRYESLPEGPSITIPLIPPLSIRGQGAERVTTMGELAIRVNYSAGSATITISHATIDDHPSLFDEEAIEDA